MLAMPMKKVTPEVWQQKASNFQARIAANPYPVNLDYYRKIVNMVTVGESVLDCGCGDEHLKEVLPGKFYIGIDPFPRNHKTLKIPAENIHFYPELCKSFDTVFCLAAIDNVENVEQSLKGLEYAATKNIVIVTGIDIPNYPDNLHTHRISRKDLTDVLGGPAQEIEISKNVWLMEWFV